MDESLKKWNMAALMIDDDIAMKRLILSAKATAQGNKVTFFQASPDGEYYEINVQKINKDRTFVPGVWVDDKEKRS